MLRRVPGRPAIGALQQGKTCSGIVAYRFDLRYGPGTIVALLHEKRSKVPA